MECDDEVRGWCAFRLAAAKLYEALGSGLLGFAFL